VVVLVQEVDAQPGCGQCGDHLALGVLELYGGGVRQGFRTGVRVRLVVYVRIGVEVVERDGRPGGVVQYVGEGVEFRQVQGTAGEPVTSR
jgi:hypothetical protein